MVCYVLQDEADVESLMTESERQFAKAQAARVFSFFLSLLAFFLLSVCLSFFAFFRLFDVYAHSVPFFRKRN